MSSGACAFCGEAAMSNTILSTEPVTQYHDGPPHASVPSTVLCYACAEDLSAYVRRRSESPAEAAVESQPFEHSDAAALLDVLASNEALALQFQDQLTIAIRHADGGYEAAYHSGPGGTDTKSLSREEAIETVREAERVTVGRCDAASWERYRGDRG